MANSRLLILNDTATRIATISEHLSRIVVPDMKPAIPDFIPWVQSNLWMKNRKTKKVQLFDDSVWTPGQYRVGEYLQKNRAERRRTNLVIHKERQMDGMSLLIQAWQTYLIVHIPHRKAATVSADADGTRNIHDYIRRFWQHLPDSEKHGGEFLVDKLIIPEPHDSSVNIFTAGSPEASRSWNFDYVHLSEVDFMEKPEDLAQALLPAIMGDESEESWDLSLIWESTAKYDRFFKRMLDRGFNSKDTRVDAIFLSPKDNPRCTVQIPLNFELTEREAAHQAEYDLSMEYMAWWRLRLEDMDGDWDRANQEWPVVSELAFRYQGGHVYDVRIIQKWLDAIDPAKTDNPILPIFRGKIEWKSFYRQTIELVPQEFGKLLIWKKPEKGKTYSMAMDTSGGVGRDYHSICILDDETGKECARWRDNSIPPEDAASFGYMLGAYYNWADWAIESNNHGHAAIVVVAHKWVDESTNQIRPPYRNLYRVTKEDQDVAQERGTIGFSTTGKTKNTATDFTKYDVRHEHIQIYSRVALLQMKGYAEDDHGNPIENHRDEVTRLKNDDDETSTHIAVFVRRKKIEGRTQSRNVRETEYSVMQYLENK